MFQVKSRFGRFNPVNNLSLKEEACKKAFYFKENSQEENLD
jgi:hypothetical protein